MEDKPIDCLGCDKKKECTYKIVSLQGIKSYRLCSSCPHIHEKITRELNDVEEGVDKTCQNCHLSQTFYKETGLLGCEKCLEAFSELIIKSLFSKGLLPSQAQLSKEENRPLFKKSDRSSSEKLWSDLSSLNKELDEAIIAEDFEKAAILRDQIEKEKKRAYGSCKSS